jgi:hypothetical protein
MIDLRAIHFIRSPVNINANEPYSYHLISEPLLFRDLGEFSDEVERRLNCGTQAGRKGRRISSLG